jgi:phage tail sheath protein FI
LPVSVSYPGVYIQELPSSTHSVTAAPTSVAAFVGYINPFSPFWNTVPDPTNPPAVPILSFADYEANFGGFFSSPFLPDYVGQAVFQFFLNGGATAYVVPIPAVGDFYFDSSGSLTTTHVVAPQAALVDASSDGFAFTALQPVGLPGGDLGVNMEVTVSNITGASEDTADLTIICGTTVETYRRVSITDLIATVNGRSALATVALVTSIPGKYTDLTASSAPFTYTDAPSTGDTIIDPTKFAPVFADGAALDLVSVFNLMALPGITDATVLAEALAYCEAKRAFYIMDPPANTVTSALSKLPDSSVTADPMENFWDTQTPPVSANGAIYFPYLQTTDPVTGTPSTWGSPPSGFVAGIFAREDNNRGVWKSPAGLETTILGTTGVVPWGAMTDKQQGQLYSFPASSPRGINCIRTFPGLGTVVFGSRTLVSGNPAYEQWKYVAVRRMALFIEQSLYGSLGWAVEEPNDTPLWNALRQEVQAFMLGLYRQGAFQGATADKAFSVRCDNTTTTQADIDQGIVNIVVGFAPLKPAEFVIVQIAQLAGQS